MGFPFVGGYLIFYGGIMNIPKEYYEACDIEGLHICKRFFKIVVKSVKRFDPIASAYATLLYLFLFLAVLANFRLQKKNALGDSL